MPKAAARSPRPSKSSADTRRIMAKLGAQHPNADTELNYSNPYELLVATILSAQCTDERVNQVTPALFKRYPDPSTLAKATTDELEPQIQSTGFFRSKSRSLLGMATEVVGRYGGDVPKTMDDLVQLPGVGRKTANVILGNAYGINEGVTVDTHVARLSALLRLTRHQTPEQIEADLMALFPRADWTLLSHLLIWHGRRVCIARRPRCEGCVVNELCPSALAPRKV